MGNLWFGKYGVLHSSLWAVQTNVRNTECSNVPEINCTILSSCCVSLYVAGEDAASNYPFAGMCVCLCAFAVRFLLVNGLEASRQKPRMGGGFIPFSLLLGAILYHSTGC